MNQEIIDLINQLDTAHLLTYIYGTFFLLLIMLLIYTTFAFINLILTKKKQKYYLNKLTEEEKNKIRKYKNINMFTPKRELDK